MKKVCWLFNSKTPNPFWAFIFKEKLADRKNRERKPIAKERKIVKQKQKMQNMRNLPKSPYPESFFIDGCYVNAQLGFQKRFSIPNHEGR